jgi:four helix bundle protein
MLAEARVARRGVLRTPGLVVGGWWLVVVTETVRNFKELRVWQGAMELVENVYRLSAAFPPEEAYGLKSQIRRAAVSIPSNIAEGQSRASTKEFLNHLSMAQASLAEVETQLEISVRLKYLAAGQVTVVTAAIQRLGKQIHALRNALEARK